MDEYLLITQCRRQDKKAQQLLFDAFAGTLMPVCVRYMKDVHEAEEALLNGFFKFFKSIETFDYKGAGSVQAWLKKIMVNECLMQLRKKSRIQLVQEEYATEIGFELDILHELEVKEIFKLIATLPDGYRTVFNLYAVEGYGHKEIAGMLQITEGTSKSQLSKAKAILQQSLQKKYSYYATGK